MPTLVVGPNTILVVAGLLLLAGRLHASQNQDATGFPGLSSIADNAPLSKRRGVKRFSPKIAGGTEAPPGRFPYVCSLRKRNGAHICGGTLIHPHWVLTAAHCLDQETEPKSEALPIVYCNIHSVRTPDESHIFKSVDSVIPDGWKHKVEKGYDIALLKLDRDALFQTATYDNKGEKIDTGEFLMALGWGQTEQGAATVLKMADKILYKTPKECKKLLGRSIRDHWICGGTFGQDTCKRISAVAVSDVITGLWAGDSGGPLLSPFAPGGNLTAGSPVLDLILGVTSFGKARTCDGTDPGIYTRVSSFADWIKAVIDADVSMFAKKPSVLQLAFTCFLWMVFSLSQLAFSIAFFLLDQTLGGSSMTLEQLGHTSCRKKQPRRQYERDGVSSKNWVICAGFRKPN